MSCRQSVPDKWLVIASVPIDAAAALPLGSGLLLLQPTMINRRRLRNLMRQRKLALVVEKPGVAARVHDIRELRRALLARTRFIFLSPMFATPSHPDWKPLPRMRAAALARLGGRKVIALGGMNRRRFATVKRLGFIGWAGVSAWGKVPKAIS